MRTPRTPWRRGDAIRESTGCDVAHSVTLDKESDQIGGCMSRRLISLKSAKVNDPARTFLKEVNLLI